MEGGVEKERKGARGEGKGRREVGRKLLYL